MKIKVVNREQECVRDKIGAGGMGGGISDISGTFLKCTWASKMSEFEGWFL